MKLNKKGFTLVELLAVIVILMAISMVAISSISAAIERNKNKQNEAKKEVILSYAKLYFEEHKNSLSGNSYVCIELDELDLSDSEKRDANGDLFENIKVKVVSGKTFEIVNESDCSN